MGWLDIKGLFLEDSELGRRYRNTQFNFSQNSNHIKCQLNGGYFKTK